MPQGVWRSEGYGYLVDLRTDGATLFEEHPQGCVRTEALSLDEVRDFFGKLTKADRRSLVMQRGPTRVRFRKVRALPVPCRAPLTTVDPIVNFEVFADSFSAYYPFAEQRGVDLKAAIGAARERARALGAGGDLFPVLTDMVAPLHDGHISIAAGERSFHDNALRASGLAPDGAAWTWRTLRIGLRDYLTGEETPLQSPAKLAAANRMLHGWLDEKTAYIAILAMGGYAEELGDDAPLEEHIAATAAVMEELLSEYGEAQGIVIDLRVNSGGYDAVALEIVSRFTTKPALAYRKQAQGRKRVEPLYDVVVTPRANERFNGKIAVLIGPDTISGAETAALAFSALPNARLIGSQTRGLFSDAIPKALPNGWTYTLSIEIVRSPDGAVLEYVGVTPDIVTTISSDAAPTARFGADIERARRLLAIP